MHASIFLELGQSKIKRQPLTNMSFTSREVSLPMKMMNLPAITSKIATKRQLRTPKVSSTRDMATTSNTREIRQDKPV